MRIPKSVKGAISLDKSNGIIFDVSMVDNFLRKNLMLVGGHNTTTQSSLTHSSVVSWESLRIDLKIDALNGVKVI